MAAQNEHVAAAFRRYLSSIIRDDLDVFTGGDISKEDIVKSIDSRVHFASKMRHRGALVMQACALHCYNRRDHAFPPLTDNLGKASTFVNHAFNVNLPFWSGEEQPELIPGEVVTMMNKCYPINLIKDDDGKIEFPGISRIRKSLADTYATCANNHAKMNFYCYQDKTIIDFLRSRGHKNPKKSCGALIRHIKRRINNLDTDEDDADDDILDELVPDVLVGDEDGNVQGLNRDDVEGFIRFHRNFFTKRGIEGAINDEWIEESENAGIIILYFVHLLSRQESLQNDHPTLKVRLFHPLPMHSMKACHIDFEALDLMYILRRAGLTPGKVYKRQPTGQRAENIRFPTSTKENAFREKMKRWWSIIFKTERGTTANREHYEPLGLRTNGVMASLIFKRRMNPDPHAPPENREDEDRTEPPLQRGHAGVDPGLVALMHVLYATVRTTNEDNGRFKVVDVKGTFEYTSAQHRHNCKVQSFLVPHIQKLQRWNDMAGTYRMFSRAHFKTVSLRKLSSAIKLRTRKEVWKRCWKQAFTKSILRGHGYCDGLKRKALQDQINHIKKSTKAKGVELCSVGFGDGSFGPSMRGRDGAVPTIAVKCAFGDNFPNNTHEVDEHRSSSSCPACKKQLKNLFHWYDGKRHYIRGIKFCASQQCKSHRFWHRDYVGAYNILIRHLVDSNELEESQIPYFLQRGTGNDENQRWIPNKSEENLQEMKTSRNVAIPRKKKMKIVKRRRKAKKKRKGNRFRRMN